MDGFRHLLIWTISGRARSLVLRGAACLILIGSPSCAFAQSEPPLIAPRVDALGRPGEALPFYRWLLFPSLSVFSVYSDNLFQSPTNPIKAVGVGVAPSLIAEWNNGIHKTTLYGNAERRFYPGNAEINTFDRQAGFVQNYSPLRDVTFRVQGDYTHRTNSSSLVSAIPDQLTSPGSVILPDGNIRLPDGTIVTPSGQAVTPGNQTS